MPVLNAKELTWNRVAAIHNFHKTTGLPRAELDLSGGVDSAVVAGLLVLALGPENVTLAHIGFHTNSQATERARMLAAAIGCPLAVADFTQEFDSLVSKIVDSLCAALPTGGWAAPPERFRAPEIQREEIAARIQTDPTILGSIRSTLRAPIGRAYNRLTGGGIRHGTGNECEDRFLRFYQKGGDGEVDVNSIAMLAKNEVWQLALGLGEVFGTEAARAAYREAVAATPSPDLWGIGDDHRDEVEFLKCTGAPFTYGRVDSESGRVLQIGTIERVSRFADHFGQFLFGAGDSAEGDQLSAIVRAPVGHRAFIGIEPDTVRCLLEAARRVERLTRHKENPNIPTLGTRRDLVRGGVLSDDFADYHIPA